jgi:UDPglucose 6-dehydrogenase
MSETGNIAFAGLSHLGIIYSMAAAAHGYRVVAFDGRPGLAEGLAAGRFPISEPGLEDAFGQNHERIEYGVNPSVLSNCALIFITLDVSTDETNNSDLAPLEALIDQVSAVAAPQTVLVLMSQVPPGFCRRLALRLPASLRLFYQVETLIFGNAVERALQPERYMVGCAEPADGLPDCYRRYLETFDCPILPMRYESAELCKIAINCFLVSSVSTANTLAEICEKIDADWSEIIPALRLDKRIGPHAYLNPGLGIAGGNLERDLATVQRLAAEYGSDARVVTAWQEKNRYDCDWTLRTLHKAGALASPSQASLAIWGLAYKADTASTKNSPAIAVLRALPQYTFRAYDPQAKIGEGFPSVRIFQSALDAVQGSTALLIMAPWKEFSGVTPGDLKARMSGRQLIDPYRVLAGNEFRESGFEYHCLGA